MTETYDDGINSGNRIVLLITAVIVVFFLSMAWISASPIPIRPSALVAGYSFNGDANDFVDSNDGTVYGATLTENRFGMEDGAYDFNALASNYIDISNINGEINFPLTVSYWIYTNCSSSLGSEHTVAVELISFRKISVTSSFK